MRWILVTLGGVALLVLAGVLWTEWRMAGVAEPAYSVEAADGPFEVRSYEPMLTASVTVAGDRREAARSGFRSLAGFIFGANRPGGKIDMTAPVLLAPQQAGTRIATTAPLVQSPASADEWTVSFVMPQGYSAETLPQPTSDAVTISEVPEARVAAVRFSGLGSEATLARKTRELRAFMRERGLEAHGAPRFAFYDPPWRLPFLRRNEVLIPVKG